VIARDWVVRHAKSIALVSVGIAVALTLTYPVLFYLDRYAGLQTFGESGLSELVNLSTAIAGALVITRQPRNAIGWMLTFIGLAGLLASTAQDYSVLANTVHHKNLVGGAFSAGSVALSRWTAALAEMASGRVAERSHAAGRDRWPGGRRDSAFVEF
jgi:hypothetical protein